MSAACNAQLEQARQPAPKRTRIELLGAENDHNYTSQSARAAFNERAICNGGDPSHQQAADNNNSGRMDDCTAAMVLMFLSSRPGEEPRRPETPAAGRKQAAGPAGGAVAKFAVMKRNSEPIEMKLEARAQNLGQRAKHFKSQLAGAEEVAPAATRRITATATSKPKTRTTEGEEESQALECAAGPARSSLAARRAFSAKRPIGLAGECDLDEDEEELLAFVEAPRPPGAGRPEDEMIFELQQVDQVEGGETGAGSAASCLGGGGGGEQAQTKLNTGSSAAAGGPRARQEQQQQQQQQKQQKPPPPRLNQAAARDGGVAQAPPTPPPLPTGRHMLAAASKQQASAPPPPPQLEQRRQLASEEARRPAAHVAAGSASSCAGSAREPSALGKPASLEPISGHQPVKTRTIFSCMWPSCPRNCDSLDDIERHVRAHLGPNSIGDEDFYYEETEVDEPTYLAIFGRGGQQQQLELELQMELAMGLAPAGHQRRHPRLGQAHAAHRRHSHSNNHNNHHQALPLSPSHNSDGLSSGHSFASSSPATSPVCSADSSSASSSSALSTSSLSSSASSAAFHLDAAAVAAGGGSGGGSGAAGSGVGPRAQAAKPPAGQLFAGGASNPLDWPNFLASSPSAGSAGWLRRPEQPGGKRRQQQQQQQARFHHHHQQQQQQQQLYLSSKQVFNLDAMMAGNSPRSAGRPLKGSSKRHQAAQSAAANSAARGRKRAQQLQERLRASIIEQLNAQRGVQHNLQFSMQLTGSSPHVGAGSGARGAKQRQLEHAYELPRGPPAQPAPSSSLATQIKSRRGRRPSAKLLAERAQQESRASQAGGGRRAAGSGSAVGAPARRGRRPQIFQQHSHSQPAGGASSLGRRTAPSSTLNDALNDADDDADDADDADENEDEEENENEDEEEDEDEDGEQAEMVGPLSGGPRRARNENRKCRKVYGMEAREQWCIQCKWKKACSRFSSDQLQ